MVWLLEARDCVDRREEQVEIAVVVEVGGGGGGIALLVPDAALAEVLERPALRWPEVPEEAALRLVAALIDVLEVPREEIESAFVV